MIDQVTIREILNRIDLQRLAEEAGAVFHGGSSLCPLHRGDSKRAFHVFRGQDGRQRWHCFTNCPEGQNGGDAIAFYMRWREVDFDTAVRDLAARVGLAVSHVPAGTRSQSPLLPPAPPPTPVTPGEPPPPEQWQARARAFLTYTQGILWSPAGAPVRDYLHARRGLDNDTLRTFGLGYNPSDDVFDDPARWGLEGGRKIWCPKGVVIPGQRNGTLWYVKVRRPLPSDALSQAIGPVARLTEVKFSGPRGGRKVLFGADQLQGLPLLLQVEGEFDALLAWQAARNLCDVASLGAARNRVSTLDAATLARYWLILAVRDADPAGEKGLAYMRSVSQRVVIVESPAHDLTDYWLAGGSVRRWVAALVAQQMHILLHNLDEQQHPDLFVKWLEVYELASTESCSDNNPTRNRL
jgi:hypothetical protein